jgi:ferritin
MRDELCGQITKELYSAFLYLSMSSFSQNLGHKGFANWFFVQYQEEMEHAIRIYQYVLNQGEHVRLSAIDKPPVEFKSALDMIQKTLDHEKTVTKSINRLVDLALKEKDHATHVFLGWYVTEQVEEEANPAEIIGRLKVAGSEGSGLFIIDKELEARVFTPSLPAKTV